MSISPGCKALHSIMTVIHMTGYQQGIFYALGCQQDSRFALRCIDRRYLDEVAHLFDGCTVYYQKRTQGKRGVIALKARGYHKSASITLLTMQDFAGSYRAQRKYWSRYAQTKSHRTSLLSSQAANIRHGGYCRYCIGSFADYSQKNAAPSYEHGPHVRD